MAKKTKRATRKTRTKPAGPKRVVRMRPTAARRAPRPKSPPEPSAPLPLSRATRAADDVTVVGVGASAGGLEAFTSLVRALPPKPGFAVVLVQHLAPQHESALPTLLTSHTSMPVVQVADGMNV